MAAFAVACLATLAAAQAQQDQQPIMPNNGRFGDATSARQYQNYLYGVIKEKNPNELILTKTKFGTDQTFKLTKKTRYVQDRKPSSFDKLSVGDKVFIDVETNKKTGDLTAKKVVSGVDVPTAIP